MTDFAPIYALGLMSGTSGDGVDVALVKTDGERLHDCKFAMTLPYDERLRERLLHLAQHDVAMSEILDIEREMTLAHAHACEKLFQTIDTAQGVPDVAGVRPEVIGFHGHTIRHDPVKKLTWQIGDPSLLAEKMSCPVVSDFRRRDIAAGGEGAPLAPLFHRELLRDVEKPTAALNIGGVANITWLGPQDEILAGDTGPGCGLLDAYIFKHTGKAYDDEGKLAATGTADIDLVESWLSDEFFHTPLPKSADRFQFETEGLGSLSVQDGAATLTEFTAAAIERSFQFLPEPPKTIFMSGGGAYNRHLARSIERRLLERWNCKVGQSAKVSISSLEAECFAWLATRRIRGLPTSLPGATGCSKPVCGGVLTV